MIMASTNASNASSSYTLARINLAAYVLNSVVVYGIGSGLAPAFLGYKGRDNASISHKYQTLVTPADGAFGIWGIIYTAQLLWTILLFRLTKRDNDRFGTTTGTTYQATDSSLSRTPYDCALQAIGYNYVDACVAQIIWTLLFASEQMTLSLLAMLSILLSLFRAVQGVRSIGNTSDAPEVNYWLYKFPLTCHFGWILAATGLNLNVTLLAWQLSSDTLFYTGLATLSVLLFQSLYMTWNRFDRTVPLTIVWALAGIYLELQSPKPSIEAAYNQRQIDAIQRCAKIGASLITATYLAKILMTQLQRRQTRQSIGEEETTRLRVDG